MRPFSNRPEHPQPRRRGVRQLLKNLLIGDADQADAKRGRLLLETLEQRQLLAGDMELLFTDGVSNETGVAVETGVLQAMGEGEGELAPDLVQFAKLLQDNGVQFFGAHWCPACTTQKELFEDGKNDLPFIEVTNPDRSLNSTGIAEGISVFPTWKFPDGSSVEGIQTLEQLSTLSGIAIPQSETPIFENIGDLTVNIGSPLHVPVDAYDPDGGPLTVTVSIDDPSLLEAVVLSGNRSIEVDMEGYGNMTFELFEGRAQTATERVTSLADEGFYDGIIFHRVINGFMIQGGDPTGTGTGGSSKGDFDDDFHPDLQHNREGVLSYAKSSDDTNDSQFFVTEVPTRHLDFNHSVFGQLVEGFDVREAISNTATGVNDRPDDDVTISTINVFNDIENSVVMLKPTGNAVGSTGVTFTVTDGDGNQFSETVTVTVGADNANSQPFLDTIPSQPATPQNTPATLQLASTDIEGDEVTYTAQMLSNAASGTVNVDSATGLVTVTPAADFAGTINVLVGVQPGPGVTGNAFSDRDTQSVEFTFEGPPLAAPTSIDLVATSDSGVDDTDNITNEGALSFEVSGVVEGALVELVDQTTGNVIGTGISNGTSITITTSNIAALGDGTYVLVARQIVETEISPTSAPLSVTYDSTAPESVVDSAATQGNVGVAYVTDLINSEEGSGLSYAFASAPTGASIDTATGVIDWTPNEAQLGSNSFTIELLDPAGNTRSESFNVLVAEAPVAEVRLELTDLQGNPITAIETGQEFLLNFIAIDARGMFEVDGVFGAYADILFDSNLVQPKPGSAITYDDDFSAIQKGTIADGLIDELGAVTSSIVPTNKEVNPIATIRMEALATGTVNIRSEPADDINSEFLLYGIDNQLPASSVLYGSASLSIGQSFIANDDVLTVEEDSGNNVLDVLNNDVVISGDGTLSIVSATQPTTGGTVSLTNGTLSFEPAENYNGQVDFTYRVSDSNGVQEDAAVTVNVTPTNDPPSGNEDTITVNQNSTDNVLNVLQNDETTPDTNEDLTIVAISSPSDGGALDIAVGGGSLVYTPAADFTGTTTFNYTISDGELEDEVSVNVLVAPADDPPTAVDDDFTIAEDTPETNYDVLANDTADAENQTFVIDSVGIPSQGGSVRISSDGTQLFYTPAADFNGTEEVTYTIRDSGGGIDSGQMTFMVTAENDAPPVTDLTVNTTRGSSATQVFELSDLPVNVDANETLTISASPNSTQGGTVSVDQETQAILYTPGSDTFVGTDSISYTVSDGNGLTSSGTITVEVTEFSERVIELEFSSTSKMPRLDGIKLLGTDLLGNDVDVPLDYVDGAAVFPAVFPGTYRIYIPGNPFLQNAEEAREIPIDSPAEAGDAIVDANLGPIKAKYLSIRDWFGSAPKNSIFTAVQPGESSAFAIPTLEAELDLPVVRLGNDAQTVVVEGTRTSTGDSGEMTETVEASLSTTNDANVVETRAIINGMHLLKISLDAEDVSFDPVDSDSGAEGELTAGQGEGEQIATLSQLTVGDIQAEGESLVGNSVTQADVFVPTTNQVQTRSDVAVLSTDQGEVWIGETLLQSEPTVANDASQPTDQAMQSVGERLTIERSAGDQVAEQSQALDEGGIDAVLTGNL